MIYVGIDDTDTADSPGTNQLARALAADVAGQFRCVRIIRHQLLCDPRVPCTSKNGSASLHFEPCSRMSIGDFAARLRRRMLASFVAGSDPGLCVTKAVPPAVIEFGRRCQSEFVRQSEARELAAAHGLHLEGLGGTEDGVVGALAAVGLAATNNDGRVVQRGHWADDVSGVQSIGLLAERGIEIRDHETGRVIRSGIVDVGKRLRPNRRDGRDVLLVKPNSHGTCTDSFFAVKLP